MLTCHFVDYSFVLVLTLVFFAFISGFIDSVVGGGGLIQIPALLINLPELSLPTILGINKIAAISGTSVAAYQYSKKVTFNFKLLLFVSFFAILGSYIGAKTVSQINVNILKPVIFVALIFIAIYTILKKDLGNRQSKSLSIKKQIFFGSFLGVIIGFYDGFLGPGTGSFLVLGFVLLLGFEFLQASAYAKVINCLTNFSALVVFVKQENYLLDIALIMAISNILGSILGTKMALKRGNRFIRIIFILIVSLMILRYGYDLF